MSYMKEALLIAQERGIEHPSLEQLAVIADEERQAGRWPPLNQDPRERELFKPFPIFGEKP